MADNRIPSGQTPRIIRAVTVVLSTLFVGVGVATVWTIYGRHLPVDFVSYWAAGRLVLSGHAAAAYDVQAHHGAELVAAPVRGLLPFGYPPPYLFVVAPLGLVSYWLAFAAWLVVTAALFSLAVGRGRDASSALAHPAVLSNVLIGQNGFLTTSLLAEGLRLLRTRPFRAGALLGLVVVKPQIAVVLPFALVAGRQWKAVAGGVTSVVFTLGAAVAVFGTSSYREFLASLPLFADALAKGHWRWNELASPFAFLRFFGFRQESALIGQAMVAVAAITFTCRAWWLGREERGPMLASASLLVSPYLFTYDSLLLSIPMLWLLNRGRHLWAVSVSWALCLLPVAGYFRLYDGPNTIPLAAILCIWASSPGAADFALSRRRLKFDPSAQRKPRNTELGWSAKNGTFS